MGWVAITVPDHMLFFFHRGPFAWNGVLGFCSGYQRVTFGVCFIANTALIGQRSFAGIPP